MIAASTMNHIGTRSVKNPRLTTTGFLRGRRSMALAVNSCGRNHALCAITASRPMASGLGVILLMNKGRIVADEAKLMLSQKNPPSSRLTTKFQR